MSKLAVAATLALVLTTASAAHADDLNAFDAGPFVGIGLVGEAVPLAVGVADIAGHDGSRTYGAVELISGGVMAGVNTLGAIALSDTEGCIDCTNPAPVFTLLAITDSVIALHGAWLLFKERPDPTELTVGSLRGRVAPTVVSDGHASTAGLGFAGRF